MTIDVTGKKAEAKYYLHLSFSYYVQSTHHVTSNALEKNHGAINRKSRSSVPKAFKYKTLMRLIQILKTN